MPPTVDTGTNIAPAGAKLAAQVLSSRSDNAEYARVTYVR